ncbi:MAG: hypothetical protein ACMUJM_12880 [bacterium]
MKNKKFTVSLLTLGISSVPTQMIIIREAMSSFSGNELVIGIIIGLWLLFTALGSAIGIRISRKWRTDYLLCSGHSIIAILPLLQLSALRAFPLFWIKGQLLGLGHIIGSSLILFPYCITAGAMIPIAGCLLKEKETTSKVYIADICGDLIGGILFSLVFVYILSHWATLVCLGVANLIAAGIMASGSFLPALGILMLCVILSFPLNKKSLSLRLPGQDLIMHKNTPFAQISITKSGEQLNVLLDAIPLFSYNDLRAEAMAHIPMSQVKEGARVLLIAGGVFGTLKEIIKHHPEHIDYVELDPSIVALDEQIDHILSHPSIVTHIGDGRLFVKKAQLHNILKYDCIILDLPDPENIQLNRFYTLEFFQEAKRILSKNGILFFTLTGAENYLGPHALALNRSVYGALKRVFPYVITLPGETHFYCASPSLLPMKIADTLLSRQILTKWLVDYQLSTILDPFRITQTEELLKHNEGSVNTDLSPSAFRHLLNLWITQSDSSELLLYGTLFLILLVAFISCREHPLQFITMSSGYTGIALELSLIIIFQIIKGYAYLWISTYVTLFMIGSALGAALSRRKKYKNPLRHIFYCDIAMLIITCFSLATSIIAVHYSPREFLYKMHHVFLPVEILAIAITIGYQFVAISKTLTGSDTEITGRLYFADLAGSSGGTFLISLMLLPTFGVIGVIVSVLIIKIVSLTYMVKLIS